MNLLRRTPLWLSVGLLWWIALLAWPPSRGFVLWGINVPEPGLLWYLTDMSLAWRLASSLGFAFGAAWVTVRALQLVPDRGNLGSLLNRAFALAWFAVGSWTIAFAALTGLLNVVAGRMSWLDALGQVFVAAFQAVFAYPLFAAFFFWRATWLLPLLGVATVLIVRRATAADGPHASRGPTTVPANS